ncbi:hypothetical protein T459_15290 [Capsicum annuum]|uniref:Uncharacterized protein n=1 Tax=Capsicum annuum TaxID=4072 RepID=A0A2G2ZK22_CAPAN|nr:hypothetical protein T459_15290 [Capsicum annuum]
MKTILLLIFLPLATCATTTDTPNNQRLIDVLDTKGKPVKSGNRYRILPTHYTMDGGGIRLANIGDQQNTTCPTSIVQAHPVTDLGILVDNIGSHLPPLPQTISTGAKLGDRLDLSSWFQIWLLGGNYQLVFCLERVVDCKYIGIVLQNGYRRLIVLSEDPIMPVLFKLDDKFGLAADA